MFDLKELFGERASAQLAQTSELFQEGLALRELGDAGGAIVCWEQCLKTGPGTHFASINTGLRGHITRHNLATAYRGLGQHEEAVRRCRLALELQPDLAEARLALGLSLQALKQWAEAEVERALAG